jgi:hypothetical protein
MATDEREVQVTCTYCHRWYRPWEVTRAAWLKGPSCRRCNAAIFASWEKARQAAPAAPREGHA